MPQPVNLTVRYIHSATRYQFIQRGCFVHGFDDIPFQEINMSVFQFRKTPLHRQGIPSRILAISPAIRDSTKVQNAVSTTSAGVSGIFQFLCVGLRTRKSMAFVLNSPWLEICLAGLPQFFNFRRSFSFSISASLSAYHFITAAES